MRASFPSAPRSRLRSHRRVSRRRPWPVGSDPSRFPPWGSLAEIQKAARALAHLPCCLPLLAWFLDDLPSNAKSFLRHFPVPSRLFPTWDWPCPLATRRGPHAPPRSPPGASLSEEPRLSAPGLHTLDKV